MLKSLLGWQWLDLDGNGTNNFVHPLNFWRGFNWNIIEDSVQKIWREQVDELVIHIWLTAEKTDALPSVNPEQMAPTGFPLDNTILAFPLGFSLGDFYLLCLSSSELWCQSSPLAFSYFYGCRQFLINHFTVWTRHSLRFFQSVTEIQRNGFDVGVWKKKNCSFVLKEMLLNLQTLLFYIYICR